MNIDVYIERLILDGINLGPSQSALLKTSIETELSHLLSKRGVAPSLQLGGAFPSIRASSIKMNGENNPFRLGQQIANALYSGISETK